MKIASTIQSPLFFQSVTSQIAARNDSFRSVRRTSVHRLGLQMETSISRKHEIVCNLILMLCLLSAVTVCLLQYLAF